MNFISLEFLLFFPIVLFLYWIIPVRFRWVLLLCVSYFFYYYWNSWTIFLLMETTLTTFLIAKMMGRTRDKRHRKIWMIVAVVVCMGNLIFFKYLGFLTWNVTSIMNIFGVSNQKVVLDIFLPVGISFYTFQTMSYVIDVYRGTIKPETKLGYYALYVSFFPQLVAGPIERSANLLSELHARPKWNISNLRIGFQLLLRGFFKKLVIADYCAVFVDQVYGATTKANGPGIVFATVLFAFQIYCDFSGYCDIAVGAAKMMGIHLMENFDEPYEALSIRDFWRRWHISLTSWFTDYVYKPLGGSRKGYIRQCVNVMIVFLLSGMWHGASWNYIIWGCIHGVYLIAEIMLDRRKNKNKSQLDRPKMQHHCVKIIKRMTVFALVCFAWIFFRASSVSDALILVQGLTSDWSINGIKYALSLMQLDRMALIRILLVLMCLPLLKKVPFELRTNPKDVSEGKMQQTDCTEDVIVITVTVFLFVTVIALAWMSLLSSHAGSSFIYFQF